MSKEEQKVQRVWDLVQHSLQLNKQPVDSASARSLQSYAVRLLSTNLTPSALNDEQSLLQSLRIDLERRGQKPEAERLLALYQELRKSMNPQQLSSTLALFARLAKDKGSTGSLDLGLTTTSSLGLMALHPSLQQPQAGASTSASTGGARQQPYSVTFPESLNNSMSQLGSLRGSAAVGDGMECKEPGGMGGMATSQGGAAGDRPGAASKRPGTAQSVLDGLALSGEAGATLSVNESYLVRDVLYSCQGVTGRFTTYKEDAWLQGAGDLPVDDYKPRDQDSCEGFVVVPEAQVSLTERRMMARLTELGWLYRRVEGHVASSGPGNGAMRQALYGALQQELSDYYRLIAVLDSHANTPLPVPGDTEASGAYLTLRRLAVWLGEPMRRMRVLALVADTTASKEGGELLGAVHGLAQHGDPFVSGFINKILQAVCVPLFNMIHRWVFEGVLEDPYQEFFVRAAPWVGERIRSKPGELATLVQSAAGTGAGGSHDLWRDGYWLEESQLPPFISEGLARKILRAGKSINFLQCVCEDVHWAQELGSASASLSAVGTGEPGRPGGSLEALERAVDSATKLVDARVMEVLSERYQLSKHCDALRRYLLLGQGDFIQTFMELVGKELSQAARDVRDMQLAHCLRTAVTSTCAKYDDEDVVERLRFRMDKSAAGGESGWEALVLQYDVPTPLATIFTPAAMAKYLRVFQLLWRLKRAESNLTSCWSTLQCQVHRTLNTLTEYEGVANAELLARRCLRLRADMSHFTTNLQYYLMFEVMETAWQEFSRRAVTAPDLDSLITAHNEYMDTLIKKSLLDEASQPLRQTLDEMTTHMLSLHGLVQCLAEVVLGADRKLQDKRRAIQSRTAQGQWGTTVAKGEAVAPDGIPMSELNPLAQRLVDLERLHAKALQTFTEQLPAQAHDEVRFLLYRLDFNDFNTHRQSAAGAF